MKINICYICVCVSMVWFVFSAGVAWGYLSPTTYLIPIALLMGGTVVGVSYMGEKRLIWPAKNPQKWKISVILVGMFTAYILLTHLTKVVVFIELILLFIMAIIFFISRSSQMTGGSKKNSKLEELIESCC